MGSKLSSSEGQVTVGTDMIAPHEGRDAISMDSEAGAGGGCRVRML